MSFIKAVLDPFAAAAEGARVPDEYAFPTETVTFRDKFIVYGPDPYVGVNMTLRPNLTDSIVMNDTAFEEPMPMPNLGRAFRSNDTEEGEASGKGLWVTGFMDLQGNTKAGRQNWLRYRIVGAGIKVTTMMVPERASGFFGFYISPVEAMNHFMLYDVLAKMAGIIREAGKQDAVPSFFDYHAPLKRMVDWEADPAATQFKRNLDLLFTEICVPWKDDPSNGRLVIDDKITDAPTGHMCNFLTFQNRGFKAALKPITSDAWDWRKLDRPYMMTPVTGGAAPFVVPPTNTNCVGVTWDSCRACLYYNQTNDNAGLNGGPGTYEGDSNLVQQQAYGLPMELAKQDGWSQFSWICRQTPAGTKDPNNGQWTVNEPIAMVEVVYHVEYVSSSLSQTTHAAIAPKNERAMQAVLRAAAESPMYSHVYADNNRYKFNRMKTNRGL